jgi:glycosyltransferase involved in cell wall biosynthesis
MKIVIVTNALSGGGAESSMRLINNHLRLSGTDSTLLCLNKTNEGVTSGGEIQLDRKWKSGIFQTISNYVDFCRVVKSIKPDFIVVNCELPELYAAFIPGKINKLICVEHTSKPWDGRKVLGSIVRSILLVRKSLWVTVNSSQKSVWRVGVEAIYIPNPVEIPKLATSKMVPPDFVFVGRLRKEKGIGSILQAISEEKKSIDIFGSGDLEEGLRARYSHVAVFHGFVDTPWKFISPEQVLIVASEYEGDGKVIVEGILAEVPILLLDNLDLRRFELPDLNYFTDGEDLRKKLHACLLHKEDYRPNNEKIIELKAERDTSSVVDSWKKLLI